jgi:hypothetical protein
MCYALMVADMASYAADTMKQSLQLLKERHGKDPMGEKSVKQHSDFLLATWLRITVLECERD